MGKRDGSRSVARWGVRLRFHRETLRTLTSREMAAVAGAVPNPRSNAWTASAGDSMINELCGDVR
jgi:hypothetical protein